MLGEVAAAGIRHTQFNLACAGLSTVPSMIPDGLPDQIRNAAEHHRVTIRALSGTCNLIDADPDRRAELIRRLAQLATFCETAGIPILTLSTGTRHPHDLWSHHPDNRSAAAHADLRHALRSLLDATAHTGVTLAFEPEPANVIRTADEAATLLDDLGSPRLRVLVDAANLVQDSPVEARAAVVEEACTRLAGRISLAHAKDLDAAGHVVAPGKGRLDFAHYLGAMRTLGRYDGPVIMHGLAPADVPAALAHLRGCA
ncbi:MAG: sugar phosphate isomerase/epimerase family protein [Gemmatimonadota bacterium]